MKRFCSLVAFVLCFACANNTVYANKIQPTDSYDYNHLIRDLAYLEDQYYENLKIETIGKTYFGHDIWAVRLGNGEKNILLVGAHHGREWITSNLLMMMLEDYAKHYQDKIFYGRFNPKLLDEYSIWFVPMLNPDGVDIQQGHIPKNYFNVAKNLNNNSLHFIRWKANALGIDLNRQYPAGWTELPTQKAPFYKGYKGEYPLQTIEVQALVRFINEIKPQALISYHSTGREIFWKYGGNQNIKRDERIANKLADLTGYELDYPSKNAIGGGLVDWFIVEYGRPAFTLELCPTYEETSPPITDLVEEWERNRFIGFTLIEELKK